MRLMKLFRNPEIKTSAFLFLLAGILLSVCLFFVCGGAGIFAAVFGTLLFGGLHFLITAKRYRSIERLSEELDLILHRGAGELFRNSEEGELAILSSELNKLLNRLKEQSEKLEHDKKFLADSLADISHQMKTPLTATHLVLEELFTEELPVGERRRLVREAVTLLERIEWLVYALLKMSRLDAGAVEFEKAEISVARLLAEALAPLEIPMELRGIQVERKLGEKVSFIGDFEWSKEAVTNILKNCMEHMEKEGRIELQGSENALYTEIVIRDTGVGIDREDLPHLFERFYRGKNSAGTGVGIGLSLARQIIVSQNGTIRAENHPEGGAQFTVRFYKNVV